MKFRFTPAPSSIWDCPTIHLTWCVQSLLLPGRLGMYNDNNSDHFADMGRFIAENLVAGKEIWDALEEGVKDYKIVY